MAILDAVMFTPVSSGTGDFVVSAAVQGYQTPVAAGAVNGQSYYYRAESSDLSQWEIGLGTYTSGTTTLARTTVLFNSAGTTAKISFTAAPKVGLVELRENLLAIDEANSWTATQKAQARINMSAASIAAMAFNNMAINSGMEISQEATTNVVTLASGTAKYPVDGIQSVFIATTGAFTTQQTSPLTAPSLGVFISRAAQLKATTAMSASPATGEVAMMIHPIEGFRSARCGFGTANASSVTISFWVNCTVTGTFAVSIRNGSTARSYVRDVVVNAANTWEYKTVTIPGDTSGSWNVDSSAGMFVSFCFASGATFKTTANAWQAGNFSASASTTNFFASINNVVAIAHLCVLPGTEAPPVERSGDIIRPLDQELILCRRYYEKSYGVGVAPGTASATGAMIGTVNSNSVSAGQDWGGVRFSIHKRTVPGITIYGFAGNQGQVSNQAGTDLGASTGTGVSIGENGFITRNGSGGTATTTSFEALYHYTADARF